GAVAALRPEVGGGVVERSAAQGRAVAQSILRTAPPRADVNRQRGVADQASGLILGRLLLDEGQNLEAPAGGLLRRRRPRVPRRRTTDHGAVAEGIDPGPAFVTVLQDATILAPVRGRDAGRPRGGQRPAPVEPAGAGEAAVDVVERVHGQAELLHVVGA